MYRMKNKDTSCPGLLIDPEGRIPGWPDPWIRILRIPGPGNSRIPGPGNYQLGKLKQSWVRTFITGSNH